MNNPRRILQAFDRHLTTSAELTIFGRAALALGYPDSPATFATTRDVDAILPLSCFHQVEAVRGDVANSQSRQPGHGTGAGAAVAREPGHRLEKAG